MNAVIPDHAVTEPSIRMDGARLVIEVPNHQYPTVPLRRSFSVQHMDPVEFAKQVFMLGEIHARRCALADAMREEESATQSFDTLADEAF